MKSCSYEEFFTTDALGKAICVLFFNNDFDIIDIFILNKEDHEHKNAILAKPYDQFEDFTFLL
jgi:hypothetical protein